LYKAVLEQTLPWLDGVVTAKLPKRLPVVLSMAEVDAVLARVTDTSGLMLQLLYGTGMRIMDYLRLGVKDLDFGASEVVIREGKGSKDRVTMLPASLASSAASASAACSAVAPGRLSRWFRGNVSALCTGQKISTGGSGLGLAICLPVGTPFEGSAFGADGETSCRREGATTGYAQGTAGGRHYHVGNAAHAPACLRHPSLAKRRTVQELLGHKDVSTPMIYTHVLNGGGRGIVTPLDRCCHAAFASGSTATLPAQPPASSNR
jgi:hypothetical protein